MAAQTAQQVSIVEMLDEIAADATTQMKKMLLKRLSEEKVRIICGAVREEITEDSVIVTDKKGTCSFSRLTRWYSRLAQFPNTELGMN